ncbi:hypothetical protein NHX12_021753 [Muraenolepis orangiensis]|uniref:Uncharacterized protein n=1 Tax=Muraenolepis orangiensis TaxID=630683 RepID=A0A9Q0IUP4_9TELE|nr:hypothetical protein NHX12_021753 [Muraenolepis orangiensis]
MRGVSWLALSITSCSFIVICLSLSDHPEKRPRKPSISPTSSDPQPSGGPLWLGPSAVESGLLLDVSPPPSGWSMSVRSLIHQRFTSLYSPLRDRTACCEACCEACRLACSQL